MFEVACRALKPDFVEAVKRVTAALVKVVPHGVPEYRARWQIDPNRHLQRAHEAGGDLVLNFEYFVEIPVEVPGPQV